MIKILYITYNLNNYSGAAYQAQKLAEKLKSYNTSVTICNFSENPPQHEKNKEDNVYHLQPNSIKDLFKFLRILVSNKFSLLHFHVFLKKFLLLSTLLNKKIILKTTLIGDDDFETVIKSKVRTITKFILNRIDTNVVLSEHARVINSKYFPGEKIVKIPNAVDSSAGVHLEEKDAATFCTVGVICERKQTFEIIKYFHLHYSHLENAILYIIGPNSVLDKVLEFDERYYTRCQEYIQVNGLNKKITFTGKLPKKEVNQFYRRSKGFLFFSLKEGLPNVVLEAMSCNCVPIVTEMDGVSYEIIENGKDGFILEDISKEIPFNSINEILSSGSCQQKIRNKFSIDDLAMRYYNLYQNISGKARSYRNLKHIDEQSVQG